MSTRNEDTSQRLTAAHTPTALSGVISAVPLNGYNLAHALHCASSLASDAETGGGGALVCCVSPVLEQVAARGGALKLGAKHIGKAIFAVSKLGRLADVAALPAFTPAVEALRSRLATLALQIDCQALSNSLYALAVSDHEPSATLIAALLKAVNARAPELNGRDVATFVRAKGRVLQMLTKAAPLPAAVGRAAPASGAEERAQAELLALALCAGDDGSAGCAKVASLSPADVGDLAWVLGRLAPAAFGSGQGAASGLAPVQRERLAAACAALARRASELAGSLDWQCIGHVSFFERQAARHGILGTREADALEGALARVCEGALRLGSGARARADPSVRLFLRHAHSLLPAAGVRPGAHVLVFGSGKLCRQLRALRLPQQGEQTPDAAGPGLRTRHWRRFARRERAGRTWPARPHATASSRSAHAGGSGGGGDGGGGGGCGGGGGDGASGGCGSGVQLGMAAAEEGQGAYYDACALRMPALDASLVLALHGAAWRLRPGAPVFVIGCEAEGIRHHGLRSLRTVAAAAPPAAARSAGGLAPQPRPLFENVRVLAAEGGAVVLGGTRAHGAPARARDREWRAVVQIRFPPCHSSLPAGCAVLPTVPWPLCAEAARAPRCAAAAASGAGAAAEAAAGAAGTAGTEGAAGATSAAAAPLPWVVMPGLFAGGELDLMTTFLLQHIPKPPARARILDYGCGSGAIAAALALRGGPGVRLTLQDSDAVALVAARRNVPAAESVVCADRLRGLPPAVVGRGFDWLVSNPPVHACNGIEQDFRMLRALVRGAPKVLRHAAEGEGGGGGGVLWIVAQEYVPCGPLLRAHGGYGHVDCCYSADGRFVLWRAAIAAATASAPPAERAPARSDAGGFSGPPAAKRARK